MKNYCLILLLTIALTVTLALRPDRVWAQAIMTMEQLDEKYKGDWDKPEYAAANAAANEPYYTTEEKKVFYYINLVRMNPKLFAATYAKDYAGSGVYSNHRDLEQNKVSLISDLNKLEKLSTLLPGKPLYDFAKCHATGIGEKGLVTHDRSGSGCPTGNFGENISFGKFSPLDVVMQFLNDAGVPSFGHRKNCLDPGYTSLGLSIQNHKVYGQCTVLDFAY